MVKKIKAKPDRYNGYTSKQLNQIFYYEDGELYWRMIVPHRTKCKAHVPAKENSIMYKHKVFYKQFLIFFLAHSYLPYEIEYIDGDTTNHRIENLRAKDYRIQKSSKHAGIYWNRFRGKWIAQISKMSDGILKYLWSASFLTEEEAIDALNNPFKYPIKPKGIRKAPWGNKNWIFNFKKLNNKYEYIGEYKTYEEALKAYYKTYEEYYGISWEQEVREQLKKMYPLYAVPLGETIPLFDDTIIAKAQKTEKAEKETKEEAIIRPLSEKEYVAALKKSVFLKQDKEKEESKTRTFWGTFWEVIKEQQEKEFDGRLLIPITRTLCEAINKIYLSPEDAEKIAAAVVKSEDEWWMQHDSGIPCEEGNNTEDLIKEHEQEPEQDEKELNYIKGVRKALEEAFWKTDAEMDKAEARDKEGGKHPIQWMNEASDFMKKPTTRLYGDMEDVPEQLDRLIQQNEQQYQQQLKENNTIMKNTELKEHKTPRTLDDNTDFVIKHLIENILETVKFLNLIEGFNGPGYYSYRTSEYCIDRAIKDLSKLKELMTSL